MVDLFPEARPLRLSCLAPGCRRTCAPINPKEAADEEFICTPHLMTTKGWREYDDAWDAAMAADRLGSPDPMPYVRVTAAFDRCARELGIVRDDDPAEDGA